MMASGRELVEPVTVDMAAEADDLRRLGHFAKTLLWSSPGGQLVTTVRLQEQEKREDGEGAGRRGLEGVCLPLLWTPRPC